MAGNFVIDQIQLGNNGTPGNNFVIKTLNDGSMKIQRGNIGGSLTDILTIDANGKPVFAWEKAGGQQNLTSNGYQVLGNGLIMQWCSDTFPSVASPQNKSVTMPIAFPNAILIAIGADRTSGAQTTTAITWRPDLSSTSQATFSTNDGQATGLFSCLAIGY